MSDQLNRRDFLLKTTAALAAAYVDVAGSAEGETSAAGSKVGSTAKNQTLNCAKNRAVYQSSSIDEDHTGHLVTDGSDLTFWKPQSTGEQWIAVDLGRMQTIDGVTIHWGDTGATTYRIEISPEESHPNHWTKVYDTHLGKGGVEDIPLQHPEARFVRLLVVVPDGGLSVKELEVWSKGIAAVRAPHSTVLTRAGAMLTEGWSLQSALFTSGSPESISSIAPPEGNWLPALVPGTVLASYLSAGAVPDPYYGSQIWQISEDFFTRNDFWYRNSFVIAPDCKGRRLWLAFDGINWKAEVYVNGKKLGEINGAFIRSRLDITDAARIGETNHVAVLVRKVEHPGKIQHKRLHEKYSNGGILGLDSPTFVSSIGWNWVPTIPGRNIGIWNNVHFETTGDVVLEDPWVSTKLPLPDLRTAELTLRTEIRNLSTSSKTFSVVLVMEKLEFRKEFTLQGNELRSVEIGKDDWKALEIKDPQLWWPNGYGDAVLHRMEVRLELHGAVLDEKEVIYGIRQMGFREDGKVLTIYVNGQRIFCRGGNWGMEDGMLICDPEGYDLRVRMHKDMNMVMIRNWVGMIGRDAFYDACDRHGILIWDDFWLANPVDGPEPTDHSMFMSNALDKIRRVRSHASVAFYCGRNEGVPPADLNKGLADAVEKLDGTRYYLPASDRGLVTGHGPYENQDPEWYFEHRGDTFHSEQGIVCVPPVESMRAMMPEENLWPISDMWAHHDYQEPRSVQYTERIRHRYGEATGLEDYCRKSQMVNMESAKAIFECFQSKQGSGQLIWMSQSAWPALICQLYDYYFEQTAAYFGAKTGCRPVHIVWDQHSNLVKAANNTQAQLSGLLAEAWIYDLEGKELWHRETNLELASTSTRECFLLERPTDIEQTVFVRLRLSRHGAPVSENFYWTPGKRGDCKDLNNLAAVKLIASAHAATDGKTQVITAKVTNPVESVALAIRLKLVHGRDATRVLPAMYEDNYFSLLPHESRTISIRVGGADYLSKPKLGVEGWNIKRNVFEIL
jgi:hypothetical protein